MDPENLTVLLTVDQPFADAVASDVLRRAVRAAIERASLDGTTETAVILANRSAEMSIRLTGDEEIRELNRTYRGVDRATDVLSFSFVAEQTGPAFELPSDWPLPLGEIVIALPYAQRQAADLGHPLMNELCLLVVHGVLQLLGYTHDTDEQAEHMEHLEREALEALGVSVG